MAETKGSRSEPWRFELYVAGISPKQQLALRNLTQVCDDALGDNYKIDVIDILEQPELVRNRQILATPTVIRTYPLPERRVIGDFTQRDEVYRGLELPRLQEDRI
ncbi:MAG: circadian clock KaiB family protein [bacterium]